MSSDQGTEDPEAHPRVQGGLFCVYRSLQEATHSWNRRDQPFIAHVVLGKRWGIVKKIISKTGA